MLQLWPKHYKELVDFIEDEPGVVIKEDLISIDKEARSAFYKEFDKVRTSFLGQNYSEWLDEAHFLSTKYMKVKDYLSERLRLEEVLMPLELERFLSDPVKQVVRDLFDPLFELLQEKIEPEEFEERAEETVHESFRNLYQMGYIKWFVLSFIKNINPEKAYEVPLPQPSSKQMIFHRERVKQNIPFPEETKVLSFEVGRREILLIPDFIVRSAKLEKYVAFRTEIGKPLWQASFHSKKREWFSIESFLEEYGITEMKPDLLLYVDENLEDVSLVSDCDKFCRPDLLVYFLDQLEDVEERHAQKMESIRVAHDILKPAKGTCVIAKNHLPSSLVKGLDANIHVIHFGFNNLKWEILLDLLQE